MLDELLAPFGNGTVQAAWGIGILLVWLIAMVRLKLWYHRSMSATPEGRRLLEWQRTTGADGPGALDEARRVARGGYGEHVRAIQRRAQWTVVWWLLGVALATLPLLLAPSPPD